MHATAYIHSRNCRRQPRGKGFTLIELAVAIAIITLLLGSLLVPLQTQIEQRQISDTQKALDDFREALLGFAVANGYLPCPDTDNDGLENVNTATGLCSTISSGIAAGYLPWNTLGVTVNADAWGNRFRYLVNERFSRRSPDTNPISISTSLGTYLQVCTTQACSSTLTTRGVAVVLSYGKNGWGGQNMNSATGNLNTAPTSNDELENTDSDRNVVSHTISAVGSGAGEFDDIVTWLSDYVLFNRMVAAGKLP